MPGLDGRELCRRVCEHPGALYTYFVFLTALTHKSEILEGMHEGAGRNRVGLAQAPFTA